MRPVFKASVTGMQPYTPEDIERDVGLPYGHPMQLSLDQSQLLLMRPLPALGSHRTPVRGLYLSGAAQRRQVGYLAFPAGARRRLC
jgi:phytoene dehydrogenase-like protein